MQPRLHYTQFLVRQKLVPVPNFNPCSAFVSTVGRPSTDIKMVFGHQNDLASQALYFRFPPNTWSVSGREVEVESLAGEVGTKIERSCVITNDFFVR